MLTLPRGAEWIIILVIVLLIFGVGRLGKIGGELGKSIREFREGLGGGKESTPPADDKSKPAEPANPTEEKK
jgi:sec-independent protein translocase protein TatA